MAAACDSSEPLESTPEDLENKLLEWYKTSERPIEGPPDSHPDVTPETHTMDELVKYCLSKIPWEVMCLYFGISKQELFVLKESCGKKDKEKKKKDIIDYIKRAKELPKRFQRTSCDVHVVGTVKEHVERDLFSYSKLGEGLAIEGTPQHALNVKQSSREKTYNYERPFFAIHRQGDKGGYSVVVHAFPGLDYLRHYYYMIRVLLVEQAKFSGLSHEKHAPRLRLTHFPEVHSNLWAWTAELDEKRQTKNIRLGDSEVVVVGHVADVARHLNLSTETYKLVKDTGLHDLLPTGSSRFMFGWHSYDHKPTGFRITLLGFKYSYWGNTAYEIAKSLYRRGTRLIVYIAKLGTLHAPKDKYTTAYIPSSFYVTQGFNYSSYNDFDNPILEDVLRRHLDAKLPEDIVSAAHVSIATIMEETHKKRDEMSRRGAVSVDNEIAQFAKAATEHNKLGNGGVAEFSAVHFATDYLRKEGEEAAEDHWSMHNSSDQEQERAKREILDKNIETIVMPFFNSYLTRKITVAVIDDDSEHLRRWHKLADELETPRGKSRVDVKALNISNVDELAQLLLGDVRGAMYRLAEKADIVFLDWYLGGRAFALASTDILGRIDGASDQEEIKLWKRVMELLKREMAPAEKNCDLRIFGQLYLNRLGEYLSEKRREYLSEKSDKKPPKIPTVVITSEVPTVRLGQVPEILVHKVRCVSKSEVMKGVLQPAEEDEFLEHGLEREDVMRHYIELYDLCDKDTEWIQ